MKIPQPTTLVDFLIAHPGAKVRVHKGMEYCDIRLGHGPRAKMLAAGVRFDLTLPQIIVEQAQVDNINSPA